MADDGEWSRESSRGFGSTARGHKNRSPLPWEEAPFGSQEDLEVASHTSISTISDTAVLQEALKKSNQLLQKLDQVVAEGKGRDRSLGMVLNGLHLKTGEQEELIMELHHDLETMDRDVYGGFGTNFGNGTHISSKTLHEVTRIANEVLSFLPSFGSLTSKEELKACACLKL